MVLKLVLVMCAGLPLLITQSANACSCMTSKLSAEKQLHEAYASALAVVSAKATKVAKGEATLEIDEIFKGEPTGKTFEAQSGPSAACVFEYDKNESYLLFVSQWQEPAVIVSSCGQSMKLKAATKHLPWLRKQSAVSLDKPSK